MNEISVDFVGYFSDQNLNSTKEWLYLACTFLQSIKRSTWRLATCNVQVDMWRIGSSQWNRFSCITQDESDVTVWWHVQMLYFPLLHNSCNGGVAYTEVSHVLTRICVLLFVSCNNSTVEFTSSGGQQEYTCCATVEVTFLRYVPSAVQRLCGKVVRLWRSDRIN